LGAVVEVDEGIGAVQATGEEPGGIAEPEKGLAVPFLEEAVIGGDGKGPAEVGCNCDGVEDDDEEERGGHG